MSLYVLTLIGITGTGSDVGTADIASRGPITGEVVSYVLDTTDLHADANVKVVAQASDMTGTTQEPVSIADVRKRGGRYDEDSLTSRPKIITGMPIHVIVSDGGDTKKFKVTLGIRR